MLQEQVEQIEQVEQPEQPGRGSTLELLVTIYYQSFKLTYQHISKVVDLKVEIYFNMTLSILQDY